MDTVACLDLAGAFIEFFPAMSGKWLIGFLAIILALEIFIVVYKFVKEVRKVLWLLSSEIDVVKCSTTKIYGRSSQG